MARSLEIRRMTRGQTTNNLRPHHRGRATVLGPLLNHLKHPNFCLAFDLQPACRQPAVKVVSQDLSNVTVAVSAESILTFTSVCPSFRISAMRAISQDLSATTKAPGGSCFLARHLVPRLIYEIYMRD